jgi:hypothetical protein
MKTGQRRNNLIFDKNKTESKNRHKNQGFEKFLTSTKTNTKSDTTSILRHLFRELEPFVQNHIETELESRQHGTQSFVQNPKFQRHTNSKLLDRQISHYFRLIKKMSNAILISR